ncbi:kinesin-related protein 4-like [Bombyx mandarina]|uniref:Kinesin-related protein 4-like n=1 Tax=Bombyx mandarina TaxID=7092 RepID=A0A6J2JHG5_BOMMA|nr:kinesin-related protein 4-like [Bombyx mandarina]
MSDNIKVVVKVRPLITREIEEKLPYQWRIKNNSLYQLDQNGKEFGSSFTFDKVYDESTKTSEVYNDIAKPIVEAAVAGFNGTIFAYGQTSSGKTYTMAGTESSPGIITLAVLNLFEIIKNIPDRDFLVRVSYIEIYNETVKDLLNIEKDNIKIHDTLQGIKVDATEKVTSSPEEVLEIIKQGEANRQTGSTNMNEKSSRSHSIFQITIESKEHVEGKEEVGSVNVSQLNLVDLAGSERAGQTGAKGLRFKEGTHINKSLSALALVIKKLAENPGQFNNYRDSKLTRILQNSLGGNAKTSIICAVTPAALEETISTLQFGNRAKFIKNEPILNEVQSNATMIQQLTKKLGALQTELECKKHLEQDNYNLQKQIAGLQRLILSGVTRHSTEDIISTRRKHPQRRITISALHSVEESTTSIPRFCTPVLKYNPMTLGGCSSDLAPLQRPGTLSTVPEETSRMVTPPPGDKRVNFEDEIIELDSDDDEVANNQTCSPIHECYDKSKTPPCVLRKTAKRAEKNLKDIVELTEREKIYPPRVAELLEKLEEKTYAITMLQDEMENFDKQSKEKDLQMEYMKKKIQKLEDTIVHVTSEKEKLETRCKDVDIKLTDWEVSYDTFKKKAKQREEELLSIVEELKTKSHTGGISLNQSLKEQSILKCPEISINKEDESSTPNLVSDLQSQLVVKNQTIIELQADICAQNQTITFLEKSSQELQDMINNYKENLTDKDEEIGLLKGAIETLNSTIKSQKSCLDTANDDIKSYNSVIQELQIKLTGKETQLNLNIEDDLLQNMIDNEATLFANNENIRNIIHAFKIRLEECYKEIGQLKSGLQQNVGVGDKTVAELKNDEINSMIRQLEEEIEKCKIVEEELTEKLAIAETKHNDLKKLYEDSASDLEALKRENIQMHTSEGESKKEVEQLLEKNIILADEIDAMTKKITTLQENISSKEIIIESLQENNKDRMEYLDKAKLTIKKLQDVFLILSGDVMVVPEIIDSITEVINTLTNGFESLEEVALEIDLKKNSITKDNISIKTLLDKLITKNETDINELRNSIKSLESVKSEYNTANEKLFEQLNIAVDKQNCIQEEVDLLKIENQNLLQELLSRKTELEKLELEILARDKFITNLEEMKTMLVEEKLSEIKEKDENFKQEIGMLNERLICDRREFNETMQEKNILLSDLSKKVNKTERELEEKQEQLTHLMEQLNDTENNSYKLIENMFNKVSQIASDFKISNQLSCELDDESENTYERISLTLDKITNHITYLNTQINETQKNDNAQLLWEAKKQIADLTEQNIILKERLSQLDTENKELLIEIQTVRGSNEEVTLNLKDSSTLLKQVKEELKQKSDEIEDMKTKVMEWKSQFKDLDDVMKQQQKELKLENKKLHDKRTEKSAESLDSEEDEECVNNFYEISVNTDSENTLEQSAYSPKSLVTICCSKILDSIQSNDTKKDISTCDKDETTKCSNCDEFSSQLTSAQDKNDKLTQKVQQLQAFNLQLMDEHELVRLELQKLIEPAHELQKKIFNHKTNLSILTATTYAENKLLNSQVKSLQHHHGRFHYVCQRDLPAFKKQLCDLLAILKNCPTLVESENGSLKRFSLPDVLEKNTTIARNESVLDGDLLMLDTNVSLTTADSTLVACDQTCLDLTQNLINEISIQTNFNQTIEASDVNSQIEILNNDNRIMFEKLEILKEENEKLRNQLDGAKSKNDNIIETQSNPIKLQDSGTITISCKMCQSLKESSNETNLKLEKLSGELFDIKEQKSALEGKYQNLILETQTRDLLMSQIKSLEMENLTKDKEIKNLTDSLKTKSKKINELQEENDTLSNLIMENVTESDNLNKEVDDLKKNNECLTQKCIDFEKLVNESENKIEPKNICAQCKLKENLIQSLHIGYDNTLSKLNRSISDSNTSTRYNKICTLQSELDAGREDCKELCEDFTSIKNHLELHEPNMTMDLDESIENANFLPQSTANLSKIADEKNVDMSYVMDKTMCLNYYTEIVGVEDHDLKENIKIIDVMKMLHNHLLTSHGNEVENLVNKLKDYEETKNDLLNQLETTSAKCSIINKELGENNEFETKAVKVMSEIKRNLNSLSEQLINNESKKSKDQIDRYKDSLLAVLDAEFGTTSLDVFEILMDNIINKYQIDLDEILEKYTKVQGDLNECTSELKSVNEKLSSLNSQLIEKENACNILRIQKERIHEISSAVTIDIVKKENELKEILTKECLKLSKLKVDIPRDLDQDLPAHKKITILFDALITQYELSRTDYEIEKEKLRLETGTAKTVLEEKEKELSELKLNFGTLEEAHNEVKSLHEELPKLYKSKVDENSANLNLIKILSEEIDALKIAIAKNKEKMLSLSEKDNKLTELVSTINGLKEENNSLKSLNDVITKEKETQASELERSCQVVKQNGFELDKMKADILMLNETVKENTVVVETLKDEAKLLLEQNLALKEQCEEKTRDCSRLEINIKTHEKTAEIQNRMIMRLQKQKQEDDKLFIEKETKLNELTNKYEALKRDYDAAVKDLESSREAVNQLTTQKDLVEGRIAELESDIRTEQTARVSLDDASKSSRSRRRSLHDSKRTFGDENRDLGESNLEAVFESRRQPDDLFMDVDGHDSNRSTPIRLKGRDSLLKSDNSDVGEEHSSRPGSVHASRRRRQSIHDSHRSIMRSSRDTSHENPKLDDSPKRSISVISDSEVSQLKERLLSCQQELDDLKERYKELDDECETCAEYLQERDEQCARLKKEKLSLEQQVSNLKEQISTQRPVERQAKFADVAVNTDEDWANLHSVVVDRMSYDAEVEKNKRLMKTIEELRYKKQDLKNTVTKMQKAMEKYTKKDKEFEAKRKELKDCKAELEELKQRYKELDEECETCAEYLKQREEQCKRLKEAKIALEMKLQEFQTDASIVHLQSVRKKRRSIHDQNRASNVDLVDASTQIGDDFLNNQVERDRGSGNATDESHVREMQRLQKIVDKLSNQKVALEKQIESLSNTPVSNSTMYVATGSAIVQNQQITDVMKENQKLKKMNAKLITICKKRGKTGANRENEDPSDV